MIAAAHAPASTGRSAVRRAHLLTALVAMLALDNILLLAFLGVGAAMTAVVALAALAMIALVHRFGEADDARIPVVRWLACLAVAIVLLLLGGEGRIFYANLDWIVRDAVLDDMIRWPWPFAYAGHGAPLVLRAPLGMYLLPALAGKLAGQGGADATLLVQNGLLLSILLALGSTLFSTARARRIALVVVIAFSGMDTIGQLVTDPAGLLPLDAHISAWMEIQYSAQLTQLFWVPQHALCGWFGAVLFLLWRDDRIALGSFLGVVPLLLIWSPLGAMGTMPFAALAAIETMVRGRLTVRDIVIPLLALAVAILPALYLQAAAGRVGVHLEGLPPGRYLFFEMIEVLPLLLSVWMASRFSRFGMATGLLVSACLLLFPFIVVGTGVDFVMRASIPALAILSVMVADLLSRPLPPRLRAGLVTILAIGALTPARELYRAVLLDSVPTPACDLWTVADRVWPQYGKDTYFASEAALPSILRPASPHIVAPLHAPLCWPSPWARPRF
jgi:hypothetical protein